MPMNFSGLFWSSDNLSPYLLKTSLICSLFESNAHCLWPSSLSTQAAPESLKEIYLIICQKDCSVSSEIKDTRLMMS